MKGREAGNEIRKGKGKWLILEMEGNTIGSKSGQEAGN